MYIIYTLFRGGHKSGHPVGVGENIQRVSMDDNTCVWGGTFLHWYIFD